MKTMVKEPYVHHIPMLTGGEGFNGVQLLQNTHFVGKMLDDTKVKRISRTVHRDQVLEELILSFTHDRPIDFMILVIQPTGKYVELPHVVVMKFNGNKIAHQHIYWDQASLLAQKGILDANKLPVAGIEQSKRLQELAAKETKEIISKQQKNNDS